MPTPLAHGVAGYAIVRSFRDVPATWRLVLAAFLITIVPDLDFLPGVLIGSPAAFHRGPTHSLVGGMLLSLPIAVVLIRLAPRLVSLEGGSQRPGFRFWYGFALIAYTSHLLLDLLSPDIVDNSGLQLWWPFTTAYARAPIVLHESVRAFFDLQLGPANENFFATLFSLHGLAVYFAEALLFSPILLVPLVLSRLRRRRRDRLGPAVERGTRRTMSRDMAAAAVPSSPQPD